MSRFLVPPTLGAMLALVVVGCASDRLGPGVYRTTVDFTRFAWQCPSGDCRHFANDNAICQGRWRVEVLAETNLTKEDAPGLSPRVADLSPYDAGRRTLYKDCLEKRGYVKLATASIHGHVFSHEPYGVKPFRMTQPADQCAATQPEVDGVARVDLVNAESPGIPCRMCPLLCDLPKSETR